jgi:hypothetical protein
MFHSHRRTVRGLALALALVAPFVLAGTAGSALGNKKQEKKVQKAGQVYKNLQLLKDVPADQIIPIMHKINDSLGVKCDFCHIIETDSAGKHVGWEKDDKPMKGVARKMITLVNSINKREKILGGKATCNMCHHGHPEPELNPPAGK